MNLLRHRRRRPDYFEGFFVDVVLFIVAVAAFFLLIRALSDFQGMP